jgi:hypothetical protein
LTLNPNPGCALNAACRQAIVEANGADLLLGLVRVSRSVRVVTASAHALGNLCLPSNSNSAASASRAQALRRLREDAAAHGGGGGIVAVIQQLERQRHALATVLKMQGVAGYVDDEDDDDDLVACYVRCLRHLLRVVELCTLSQPDLSRACIGHHGLTTMVKLVRLVSPYYYCRTVTRALNPKP